MGLYEKPWLTATFPARADIAIAVWSFNAEFVKAKADMATARDATLVI